MISITSANNLRANKNNKNPRKMKEKTYEFFIIYTLIFKITTDYISKNGPEPQLPPKNILCAT